MMAPREPPSLADVDGNHIVLRLTFADMLVAGRIPGAIWDARRKAQVLPGSQQQAAALMRRFPRLVGTPAFKSLLGGVDHGRGAGHAGAQSPLPPVVVPEPAVVAPDGMKTRPWRHQLAAYRFCLEHFAKGQHGLLLAMMMGTGKTLVGFMVMLERRAKRTLILCPLRVVPVWATQIERHVATPMVVVSLDDSVASVRRKQEVAAEKLKLAETLGRPFVCVINYDSFWREPFNAWAEKLWWDVLILDEGHRLKAPGGKASLACKRMRARAAVRLGMSGTPMPHGPLDIYAVLRALDIRIFGPSFSAFRQKYAVMGGYQGKQITGYQHLDELEAGLARVMFRVGKEVLDLPPETDVTYHCELSAEALRVYRDLEQDFVAQVQEGSVTAANAMVKLLRLQQVTGGCIPTDDGVVHRIDTAKAKLLADTLEDIGKEEPVVVFCRFHADMDAVHEAAQSLGYTTLELSGRRSELNEWQEGGAQVLVVQIDSGGEGVDLTRARYSIFYSLSLRLDKYVQARSRTHRPGQLNSVEHIHLVARNTVDVRIMRALEKRAEVVEAILAEIASK